jgi:outer membrane protein OmpA-like peptidoglycan-associated protein
MWRWGRWSAPLVVTLVLLAGCRASEPPAGTSAPASPPPSEVRGSPLPVSLVQSTAGVPESTTESVETILSDLGAEQTEEGILITVPDRVLFAFDRATLRPGARRTLQRIARVIEAYPDAPVQVRGHTDDVGSNAYNQTLSERRAQAVVDFLVSAGVSGRLEARGFGERRPVATNATAQGRQENRRVEVVIRGVERQ